MPDNPGKCTSLLAYAYADTSFQMFIGSPAPPIQTYRCQQHRRDTVSTFSSKRAPAMRRNANSETTPA